VLSGFADKADVLGVGRPPQKPSSIHVIAGGVKGPGCWTLRNGRLPSLNGLKLPFQWFGTKVARDQRRSFRRARMDGRFRWNPPFPFY
jgi:hypothetical protein